MISTLPYFYVATFILLKLKINMVTSDFVSDEEEAYFKKEPTEEEWHMDFMPTGYLPDSVYRELAWYGILQIQPLHHSSKHKVAAQLIWEHTLGRPHVIMENPPQSTQSPGKVSRQILAEEAAKWSREQRAAQEVLIENIKSGGNGITVRTVISSTKKSIYIIQNGNYYECPHGSEPDLDAYRIQANMHERKCTFNKNSIPVSVDPCIEAEVTPIEFSFHEGWMFCLGNGERENNYFQNGTLDCGNKIKISVDEFLDKCAIDNNIVITFDYFGDEPRKDMMRNATLCSSWDPCRISYLYRLEPPPGEMMPFFPTTPADPCDTTVCPECLEGYNPEEGTAVIEKSPFVEDVEDKVHLFGYGSDNENSEWIVSKEKPHYDKQFKALKPVNGKIAGAVAKTEMMKSKLPFGVLAKIWKLSDIDKDGFLDDEEFAVAMCLISVGIEGNELPDELPGHLVPPSKRN